MSNMLDRKSCKMCSFCNLFSAIQCMMQELKEDHVRKEHSIGKSDYASIHAVNQQDVVDDKVSMNLVDTTNVETIKEKSGGFSNDDSSDDKSRHFKDELKYDFGEDTMKAYNEYPAENDYNNFDNDNDECSDTSNSNDNSNNFNAFRYNTNSISLDVEEKNIFKGIYQESLNDVKDKSINNEVKEDLELRILSNENKIWNHFHVKQKENEKVEAECIYCGKVLKRKAEKTSSFLNHLRYYHVDKLPIDLQKKKIIPSIAWNHFKTVPNMKNKAECKYCGKWISKIYGSTSNMVRHFMINHQLQSTHDKKFNNFSDSKTENNYNKSPINADDNVAMNDDDIDDPLAVFDTKETQQSDNGQTMKSVVWNHFQVKPNSNDEAKCNYCNKMFYFCDDMTGNLMYHLKDQHSVEVNGQKIIRKRVKKSFIWKHSKLLPNKEQVKCNYCHKIFISHNGTTSIKNHLESKHLDKLMYSDNHNGNSSSDIFDNFGFNGDSTTMYDEDINSTTEKIFFPKPTSIDDSTNNDTFKLTIEDRKHNYAQSNYNDDDSNVSKKDICTEIINEDITMNDGDGDGPLTLSDTKESLENNEDLSSRTMFPKIIKTRVKKSFIWDHCKQHPNSGTLECNYCNIIYSQSNGSTGNMKRHLQNKHPKQLLDQSNDEKIYNQEGDKTEYPSEIEAFAREDMDQTEENSKSKEKNNFGDTIEREQINQPANSIWGHFKLQPNIKDQVWCKYCDNCEKPSTMISHLRKNHPTAMKTFTSITK